MEIKRVLTQLKKNFDRIILAVIVPILIISSLSYLKLLNAKPVALGERDIYTLVDIPLRARAEMEDEDAFKELVDKKANFILGIKPAVFYNQLMYRNPFASLRDLVVKSFSLDPKSRRINIGDKVAFQVLNGIGPYNWRCEPEDFGIFNDNIFEAKTDGAGRIIAQDARGHEAIAEVEVATKDRPVAIVREEKINFKYRGVMKISGEEALAFVEDTQTKRPYFKKSGEEIDGFIIKEFNAERLILLDKKKDTEIELARE